MEKPLRSWLSEMNRALVASPRNVGTSSCGSSCKISDLPLHVRARILEHLCKSNNSYNERCMRSTVVFGDIMQFTGVSGIVLPESLLSPALASPVLSAAVVELLGPHARNLTRQNTNGQLSLWLRALWPYVTAVSFHDTDLKDLLSDLYMGFRNSRSRRVPRTVLRDTQNVFMTLSQSHFGISKLDLSQVPFQYATIINAKKLRNALAACLRQNAKTLQELTIGSCAISLNSLGGLCFPKLKRLEFHRTRLRFATEERLYYERKSNARVLNALGRLTFATDDLELALNEVPLPLGENVNIAKYPHSIFDRVSSLVIQSPFGLHYSEDDKVAAFISCFANVKQIEWNGSFNVKSVNLLLRKCPRLKVVRWRQIMVRERDFIWHDTDEVEASELPQVFALLKEKLRTLAVRTTMTEQHFNALSANCLSLECVRLRIGPKNACHLKNLLRNCRGITSVTLFSSAEDIDGEGENMLGEWPSYWNKLMLRAKGWEELAEAVALASPKLRQFKVLAESIKLYGEVDVKDAVKSMASITKSLGENAQSVCFQIPFYRGTFNMIVDAMCDVLNAAIDSCQSLEVLELDFYGPFFKWEREWENEENRNEKIAAFLHALDQLKKNAPKLRKFSSKGILDPPVCMCLSQSSQFYWGLT